MDQGWRSLHLEPISLLFCTPFCCFLRIAMGFLWMLQQMIFECCNEIFGLLQMFSEWSHFPSFIVDFEMLQHIIFDVAAHNFRCCST
jgi:hypothetical protein